MEQATSSTKGKGLGLAGMIIGIIVLIWAIIPIVGATALWVAIVGLIISVIGFFVAKSGNNSKKGMIITGIILNLAALGLALYWISAIAAAASQALNSAL